MSANEMSDLLFRRDGIFRNISDLFINITEINVKLAIHYNYNDSDTKDFLNNLINQLSLVMFKDSLDNEENKSKIDDE